MESPGLYLHVPFCARVCPYCDFAVQTGGPRRRAEYVEALQREMEAVRERFEPFDTVYLGGGTPSCLGLDQLECILGAVRSHFALARDPWLTLEANPEDVSDEAARAWRRLGVRTLSLGVQAFDDRALLFLGRSHTADQASEAVICARDAGFEVVSLDLIFGLPGQHAESWRRQLQQALELQPDHISCYQLTFHAGTRFGRRLAAGELCELAEADQARLFQQGCELLRQAGFEQYEVSSFAARPQARSRHNRKYWRHVPYLGIGPSAHSFDGSSRRWWNERRLPRYLRSIRAGHRPVAGEETLSPRQIALEAVLFGMRTREGLQFETLRKRTGIDLREPNRRVLEHFRDDGFVILDDRCVRPTRRGLALADLLAREIVVPAEPGGSGTL